MNNPPPAFPEYENPDSLPAGTATIKPVGGVTLRDYFAAHAMATLTTRHSADHAGEVASCAYMFADAMLREREKGET